LTSFRRILREYSVLLGKLVLEPTTSAPFKADLGPLNMEIEPKPSPGRPAVVRYQFSQMKIKHQPPAPPYPAAAKVHGVQGTVEVEITVDPQGHPIDAMAISGPEPLVATAIAYALLWEFEPAILNGVAQTARFRLTMPFHLR
jgi:TonB family protein